jgi:predicted transcriptional regulator
MQPLAKLLQSPKSKPQGPSPTFERAHLLLAFLTIGESGTIGRHSLAVRVGLGEGAVRTVLKRLREEGLADADASGCHLTKGGQKVYSSLSKKLSPLAAIEGSRLTMGASQVAVSVSGGGETVRSGIEQRDSAIGVGAAGATTYVVRGSRFTVPGGSDDCESDFPSRAWAALRKQLKPRSGDAVILCGSDREETARLGALSAALTLL